MKTIKMISIMACLAGCGMLPTGCLPEGNLEPELFRGEYEAIAKSADFNMDIELRDIDFVESTPREINSWCSDSPCVAVATGTTILVTPPPANHCDKSPGTDEVAASVYIHELLHVLGFEHGKAQDDAHAAAWAVYRDAHCQ